MRKTTEPGVRKMHGTNERDVKEERGDIHGHAPENIRSFKVMRAFERIPQIKPGSYIYIDVTDKKILNARLYVLTMPNGEVDVREVLLHNETTYIVQQLSRADKNSGFWADEFSVEDFKKLVTVEGRVFEVGCPM